MSALEHRLAAVWFADLVDYTRLAAEDEGAALTLVQDFQQVARDVVQRARGRIVKFVGDAALAEFGSAHAALAAALELAESMEGAERRPVRIGVHLGEVAGAPDGDLYGDGVNLASRLHQAAEPGQVVASEDVARQLRRRPELRFEALGEREIKGMPGLVRVFAVRRAAAPSAAAMSPAGAAAAPARAALAGSGGREEPSERSIAVLPFTNLSADPDNEYFSDGVTEELLTALAGVDDLKVISRTSVMRYKGTTRPLREIGRELGVAAIVEGSVRKAGARVRITAQLIDARTDRHLWAERYDRDLEDIFAIQTDVAERIVEALKVRLTPSQRARITAAPTSLPAYQAYLRGLWFLNRRTPDDLKRSIEHFERAVDADAGYAPAWAGIAGACALQLHWEPSAPSTQRAITAADRAWALDPTCGEACAARAMIRIYERDWATAEHDFRCAIRCNPGDANARQWFAHFLACTGRFDDAMAEIDRARELDPLSLVVLTEAGNVHYLARRYAEAVGLYREALELDPSFRPARYKLTEIHQARGRLEDALAEYERLGHAGIEKVARLREAIAAGSGEAYYRWLADQSTEWRWPLTYLAHAQLMAGDREAALGTLERAIEERDWYLIRLAVAPHWDPLRDDPRFRAILERIGLADVEPAPEPS